MTEMVELLMDVRKEIRCAEMYASEARKHKKEYPELSMAYGKISAEKLSHAEMLARHAEMMARKANMMDVWEVESAMIEDDMEHARHAIDERYK